MSASDWTSRGNAVAQLIEELRSFEDQGLEVRLSVDGGNTSVPISLVGKLDGRYAVLLNFADAPSVIRHEYSA